MKNRRQHQRFLGEFQTGIATNLIFMYEILDDHIVDGIKIHREGLATILNLSKSGCLIHGHAPFPLKTRLLITMTPPACPNEKIVLTGVVRRQEPGASDDYQCGIEFIELQNDSQAMLDKFIERLVA